MLTKTISAVMLSTIRSSAFVSAVDCTSSAQYLVWNTPCHQTAHAQPQWKRSMLLPMLLELQLLKWQDSWNEYVLVVKPTFYIEYLCISVNTPGKSMAPLLMLNNAYQNEPVSKSNMDKGSM